MSTTITAKLRKMSTGQLSIFLTLLFGLYPLFSFFDRIVSKEKRRKIAQFIAKPTSKSSGTADIESPENADLHNSASSADITKSIIDALIGQNQLLIRGFFYVATISLTITSLMIAVSFYDLSSQTFRLIPLAVVFGSDQRVIGLLVLLSLGVFIDYISIIQTRFFISLMKDNYTALRKIMLGYADIALTFTIFLIFFPFVATVSIFLQSQEIEKKIPVIFHYTEGASIQIPAPRENNLLYIAYRGLIPSEEADWPTLKRHVNWGYSDPLPSDFRNWRGNSYTIDTSADSIEAIQNDINSLFPYARYEPLVKPLNYPIGCENDRTVACLFNQFQGHIFLSHIVKIRDFPVLLSHTYGEMISSVGALITGQSVLNTRVSVYTYLSRAIATNTNENNSYISDQLYEILRKSNPVFDVGVFTAPYLYSTFIISFVFYVVMIGLGVCRRVATFTRTFVGVRLVFSHPSFIFRIIYFYATGAILIFFALLYAINIW